MNKGEAHITIKINGEAPGATRVMLDDGREIYCERVEVSQDFTERDSRPRAVLYVRNVDVLAVIPADASLGVVVRK